MANDDTDLDPSLYVRSPILDVPGGIALSIALLSAYKKHAKLLPKPVGQAARSLRKTVVELQSGWDGQRSAALSTKEDPRPADQREDRAFAAVAKCLEALMLLPETIEESRRAAKLYQRLFPNGLAFLQLRYPQQWAECQQRVRDIESNELEGELRELCQPVVIDELHAAHENYGRALGITTAKDAAPKTPRVAEQLRAVQQAMADYALQLLAAGRHDREIVPNVVACLGPIDELRAAEAARSTGTRAGTNASAPASTPEAPTVTPTTPIPSLDGVE